MSEMISMLNQKAVFGHEDHRLLFILGENENGDHMIISKIKQLGFEVAYDHIVDASRSKLTKLIRFEDGTLSYTQDTLREMVEACAEKGIYIEIIGNVIKHIDSEYQKYMDMFDNLKSSGVTAIDMDRKTYEKVELALRCSVSMTKDSHTVIALNKASINGITINVID